MQLVLKVASQKVRLLFMKELLEVLPPSHDGLTLQEVDQWSAQVEEIHKLFLKQHEYFEMTWPTAHIEHEYFSTSIFNQEVSACSKLRRTLARLHSALQPRPRIMDPPTTPGACSRLPDITLPKFKGSYLEWPTFRDLFQSLIFNNSNLSNMEVTTYEDA